MHILYVLGQSNGTNDTAPTAAPQGTKWHTVTLTWVTRKAVHKGGVFGPPLLTGLGAVGFIWGPGQPRPAHPPLEGGGRGATKQWPNMKTFKMVGTGALSMLRPVF